MDDSEGSQVPARDAEMLRMRDSEGSQVLASDAEKTRIIHLRGVYGVWDSRQCTIHYIL